MLNFFVSRIDDPDYGVYYALTVWGYTALAIILILLILLVFFFSSRSSKRGKMSAREITFCSVSLALGYISSTFLKIVHMPMGGSITLFSMLFIVLIGWFYGLRTGLTAALAFGMLQFITNPWITSIPQVLFDYILAFSALGLSGLFRNSRHGLLKGYLCGVAGRFLFSFISGMAFFASGAAEYNMSVPVYSLIYNGAYIGGEALLTVIVLLIPPVNDALARIKKLA